MNNNNLTSDFRVTFHNESTANQSENSAPWSTAQGPVDGHLAITILHIFLPIIIFFGTVGNLLSIIVLTRRSLRMTPIFFYLTLLAIADSLVLYISAFKSWIRILTSYELLHASDAGCRVLMYLLLCAFYLSSWLIVLLTIDRFIMIFFPFRGYLLLRIKRARIAALCLVTVVALCNLHVFWSIRLRVTASGGIQCGTDENDWFMNNVFDYLKLVTYSCVPFLIVLTLNVCVILRIAQQTREHFAARAPSSFSQRSAANACRRYGLLCPKSSVSSNGSTGHPTPEPAARLGQRRLTRMLLLVSFLWLVLTAPFTVHALFLGNRLGPRDMLIKSVCFLLMYVNHATNFYLYCVTGQRFRNELKKIFRRCCSRMRRKAPGQGFVTRRRTQTLR